MVGITNVWGQSFVVVLSQSPYVSLLKGKGYDNSFWKLLYNIDIDFFILTEEKTKTLVASEKEEDL